MSKKSYSVALIGTGRVAGIKDSKDSTSNFIYTHAKAIMCHNSFHLTAVYDANAEKSKNFAQTWSVPFIANSVQDPKISEPDVVVVSSHTDAHFRQVKELLESSHCPQLIFVEKPICKNINEFNELIELSSFVGVDILVNHTRRFDPVIIKCSEIAKSGRLGQLIYVRSDYYGGWINNCTHIIDTIMMFSLEKLDIIDAYLGANGRGYDFCLDAKLRSASSEIEIKSFDESYYQLFEIEFRYSSGRICLRNLVTTLM